MFCNRKRRQFLRKFKKIEQAVRAEVDRMKHPHNLQSKKFDNEGRSAPKANFSQSKRNYSSGNPKKNPRGICKRNERCRYCDTPVHYEYECESRKLMKVRKRKFIPESHCNEVKNDQPRSNWHHNRYHRSEPRNNWDRNQISRDQFQSLISALQHRRYLSPGQDENFRGFTAKIKYKTNSAVVSEEKYNNAFIDSGATHHFFLDKSS